MAKAEIYSALSILYQYQKEINYPLIEKRHQELVSVINRSHWHEVLTLFSELAGIEGISVFEKNFRYSAITIGKDSDLDEVSKLKIKRLVELLIPWRKGPFNLFGLEIDAEWQSNLKWDRVCPYLNLNGKKVADVGCGNGYYMFRALSLNPELIVGFDPSEKYYFQFHLFQRFLNDQRLDFKLFGIDELRLFQEFFDVILCMGVIYHRKDPETSLQILFDSLTPGGNVVIESFAIPGEHEEILVPKDRYQQLRNVHFVPTASALEKMLQKAGFKNVRTVSSVLTTTQEQRKTALMPFDSLNEFLDPNDQSKTIEGYPAPLRIVVLGEKP